ncbi:MAG: uroporphyrinogen decarboxylase family protein [Candidatus Zipacnadales bacterium]
MASRSLTPSLSTIAHRHNSDAILFYHAGHRMTSRERFVHALRYKEPDRTPFFEKLIKSPVADDILGRPHAGVNWHYRMERLADGDWCGLMEQEARDTIEVAKLLGFDAVRLYPNELPPPKPPQRLGPDVWQIGDTIVERLPSGWVRHRPVEPWAAPDWEKAERDLRQSLQADYQPPRLRDIQFKMWRRARDIIAEEGLDLAIFAAAYTMGVATLPPWLLEWFIRDRETLHCYYERNALMGKDLGLILVGEGADIVALGGDLACDHGPLISPADYREFIMPGLRLQSRAIHELGAFTSNASDGNLWPILEDFLLGTEVDAFEEIDIAAGMDLALLKQQYGHRICFIGNMDIRHLLTSGTREQVREATFYCLEKGRGNGGHILMSSNCIHESVKTDLFLAYVEAYREYYGLN